MQQKTMNVPILNPTSICCYLCGREFGTKGFAFHYKQCQVKFANEQNLRPPKDRVKKPEPPEGLQLVLKGDFQEVDLNSFSLESREIYKKKILSICKYCGRTFNYESLAPHMKGCNKKASYKEPQPAEVASPTFKTPKTLVCCVCGQRFGLTSLKIHYPQCIKKFEFEQIRKHRKQSDRRKPPVFSQQDQEMFRARDEWTSQELESFNERAMSNYREHGMVECKNCKRKFFAEQVHKHEKNCVLINGVKSQPQLKVNEIASPRIQAPKTLVCCVCGQGFGTASLKIHYPQCVKKFIFEEFRKHKKESDRRKPPAFSPQDEQLIKTKTVWTNLELQDFNQRATSTYREYSMMECYNCQRKFLADQLPKHAKNCVMINGMLREPPKIIKKASEDVRKPKSVMCLICGREYGPSSILIHIPQCTQLFNKQQSLKPKEQRKKQPILPAEHQEQYNLEQVQTWTSEKLGKYNRIVSDLYNTKSLSKCYICQRTFFEDALPKHLKQCQTNIKDVRKLQRFKKHVQSQKSLFGQGFIDRVIEMNKQANKMVEKNTRKPKVLMCYLCGREFGLTSLKIHMPQCHQKNKNKENQKGQQFENAHDISQAESWTQEQIEQYNKESNEIYKKDSLFECPHCNRTFFEESLKKHIKHCEKEVKKGKSKLRRSNTCQNLSTDAFTMRDEVKEIDIEELVSHPSRESGPVIQEESNDGSEEEVVNRRGSLQFEIEPMEAEEKVMTRRCSLQPDMLESMQEEDEIKIEAMDIEDL